MEADPQPQVSRVGQWCFVVISEVESMCSFTNRLKADIGGELIAGLGHGGGTEQPYQVRAGQEGGMRTL